MIDDRLSMSDRTHAARKFVDSNECCQDAGFGRRLKIHYLEFFVSVATIMSLPATLFLQAFFWSLQLTTALAECEHARNRNLMQSMQNWSTFSALCVLSDARAMVGGQRQRESQQCLRSQSHLSRITIDDTGAHCMSKQKEAHLSGSVLYH